MSDLTVAQQARIWAKYEETGDPRKAREAVGKRLRKAARAYIAERRRGIGGSTKPREPGRAKRTRGIDRFLLTCAQNNTRLHEPTWRSLQTLAEHYGATILVGRVMYDATNNARLHKPGKAKRQEPWFDPRIAPHVVDEDIRLADDLVWLGSLNISPTDRRPLTSLEGMGQGASAIIPHNHVALESLPRMMSETPRYNMTTGAVTQLNFIQRKVGRLAEFHHQFGAVLIEIDSSERWWARHVLADRRGRLCDIDVLVDGDEVTTGNAAQTLTCGDIHHARMDHEAESSIWSIAHRCRPGHIVLHDVLDFQSRSHHNNVLTRYRLFDSAHESVEFELAEVANWLDILAHEGAKLIVVDSNHDRHLSRWLDEADWRRDPVNAQAILRWNLMRLGLPGEHTFARIMYQDYEVPPRLVRFLRLGESCVVDGVEHGLHGDLGVNGARATPAQLAKLGSRSTVGHSHSPSILQGVYTVGTTSLLDMGYNKGPTRWAHAHCLLLANGKRQLIMPRGAEPWAT